MSDVLLSFNLKCHFKKDEFKTDENQIGLH